MANKGENMANKSYTTEEKKMSKNVQIVAYLDVDNDLEEREVCNSLQDSTDWWAESTNEWEKNVICCDSIAEEYDYDEYGELCEADDPGWYDTLSDETFERLQGSTDDSVNLMKMARSVTDYKRNTSRLSRELRRDVIKEVTLTLSSRDWKPLFSRKVKRDGETLFNVESDGPMRMGMLKHQSEIEDGDVYADKDADLWAVTLTCDVKKVKPDVYRWFDDNVIPDIMHGVANHDWTSRVRIMDCEREYSEEGVCYDL